MRCSSGGAIQPRACSFCRRGGWCFPRSGSTSKPARSFAEVGLFSAEGKRALTAVCETDSRLLTITKEKTLELYYQNPRFGMFLMRLVSDYARENAAFLSGR